MELRGCQALQRAGGVEPLERIRTMQRGFCAVPDSADVLTDEVHPTTAAVLAFVRCA